MSTMEFTTACAIKIERETSPLEIGGALEDIQQRLRTMAGGLFSSGYEYPGRYSRWDIGFINPPVELVARGRSFSFNARNDKGEALLHILHDIIKGHPHLQNIQHQGRSIKGVLCDMPPFFSEEERSRQPSLFSILREICRAMAHPGESYLGFYGAFGYDLVFQFDPIRQRHPRKDNPDAKLYLPDEIIIIDRRLEKADRHVYDWTWKSWSTRGRDRTARASTTVHKLERVVTAISEQPGEYARKVGVVQKGCRRGDYFEVVLSQTFRVPFAGDVMEVFAAIQQRNPSPYEFVLQLEDEQLAGASPEMFVRVEGGKVETCPISGTVARGASPMEDAEQIRELLSSDKEEAELTMCTDVDRNDKSRVCIPESITVLGRRLIEVYSRVIHTVDHVEGMLKPGMDGLDAFCSHMWAVTLSGSPKLAAMQAIEDLEPDARGWYGGAVGAVLFNGNINTGITIRTVHFKEGMASIRVGATLLAASDPAREEKETELKAAAFIAAVVEGRVEARPAAADPAPTGRGRRVLFVDHQDSFVHTLSGYVRRTGAEVLTLRAGFPMKMLDEFKPDLVFLSPGPYTPSYFALPEFIQDMVRRKLPMFGVCLGLQGMVEAMGGKLGVLDIPRHGVPAHIRHEERGIFKGLPNPMKASRYHSLYAIEKNLPACFEILARSEDGVIMGIRHKNYPMSAVQFHPESIHALGQSAGLRLIFNVLSEVRFPTLK